MPSKLTSVLVICFVFLLAIQSIMSMRQKSATIDEIIYIAAGYYHVKTADFQFNTTNPPGIKVLSGIPLLALNLDLPPVAGHVSQARVARTFLYNNRVDADTILWLARIPTVLLSILLGIFVFIWGKALYGEKAGLFALFLYSFSPNILAHSRLATLDLGLTAFMFISTYYFWKHIHHPSAKALILCGIFFGLAVLTKTTAVFMIPIFAIYSIIVILKKNSQGIFKTLLTPFITIGLLVVVVLNIGYGFQGTFEPILQPGEHSRFYKKLPIDNALTRSVADSLLGLPIPLPSPYIQGLKYQRRIVAEPWGAYFAGHIYTPGAWYLMIACFVLKTPIPTLILFVLSLIYLYRYRAEWQSEWLILTFIFVVVGLFSYYQNLNELRYILPIYPFIFILISGLYKYVPIHLNSMQGGLLVVLSLWYVIGSMTIYPHYLAYFNELIGGPKNGYKYLVASNLDWGQDLKNLKTYMEKHNIDKIRLGFYGNGDASYYGIDYDYLPSLGLDPKEPIESGGVNLNANDKLQPQQGILAISSTLLASPGWMQSRFHSYYDGLRAYEPVDHVGYSILIYNFH